MLGDDEDWLQEVGEEEAQKAIAQKEEQQALQTHYEVGYQGGLIERLEEQEEKAVLRTIRKEIEEKVPVLTQELYPIAL